MFWVRVRVKWCRFSKFANFTPIKILYHKVMIGIQFNMYAIPSSQISGIRCVLTFYPATTNSFLGWITGRLLFILYYVTGPCMHLSALISNHGLYITICDSPECWIYTDKLDYTKFNVYWGLYQFLHKTFGQSWMSIKTTEVAVSWKTFFNRVTNRKHLCCAFKFLQYC